MNRQSTALLDHEDVEETSGESYRSSRLGDRLSDRQTPVPRRTLPRVAADNADGYDEQDDTPFLRSQTRIRVRRGVIPESLWGRIFAGTGLFLAISVMVAAIVMVRMFLLHDPRFLIDSSSNIQINGNSHVNRAQMLSVFGEDIGRDVFYVPLAERRSELETLPWVEHATVMRLLPNRLRVSVVERTPVAFVRQDGHIGLVDAYGVLLQMPDDDPTGGQYSFPVLTGIAASDPLSTRAARMKIYQQFLADLDSSGPKLSETLSEIDMSNPEDVKALIPEHTSEILVHFGDEDFLERYQRYQQQLPSWLAQYPNLASVDMRYPNQVVLDMTPGTDASATVPNANGLPAPGASAAAGTVSVPAVAPPPVPVQSANSWKKSAATPMAVAPVAAKTTPAPAKPVQMAMKIASVVTVKKPAAIMPAPTKASAAKPMPAATVKIAPAGKVSTPKPQASTVSKLPPPTKLNLASTVVPRTGPAPAVAALPKNMQISTAPGSDTAEAEAEASYSTQHPLTQAFDAPAKKPSVKTTAKPMTKAKPAAGKTKAKAKSKNGPVVVKSKAKTPAPVNDGPDSTN